MRKHKKTGGWMMVEIVVALTLMAVIIMCLGMTANTFGRLNHIEMRKQWCIEAARAQLDSITVKGRALNEEDIERLWPGVKVSVQEKAGQGQWAGLNLVDVEACSSVKTKNITVRLNRYVQAKTER